MREICSFLKIASRGWDIEHSGGFCDATQRYSFDSFDGMLADACAAVHIWDYCCYIWDSSREPGYYWCAGREAPGTPDPPNNRIYHNATHTDQHSQKKKHSLHKIFDEISRKEKFFSEDYSKTYNDDQGYLQGISFRCGLSKLILDCCIFCCGRVTSFTHGQGAMFVVFVCLLASWVGLNCIDGVVAF